MKIGIFGGTFDPPHIGHLILAAEAQEQLQLDQVLWVLTYYPPHKINHKITPIPNRVRLVELTIRDHPGFVLSLIDIDREPPHYAVDTVALLKEQAPENAYYYLMGQDSLGDLPTWHRPNDFVALCDGIIVMPRQGKILHHKLLEEALPDIWTKVFILNSPKIEISSSDIRTRINAGMHHQFFLTDAAFQYIRENNLYQG
jgi:nicotinate-nucleotide adenylyltransferase